MQNTTTSFGWSASRLKSLLQCPRQYAYAYLDGIPAVPTAPLVFGRVMHETLRIASEQQMSSGVLPSPSEMEHTLEGLWSAALETESPFFGPRQPTAQGYSALGLRMLETFHRDYVSKPPPIAVEFAFDVTIGERSFIGTVDRVEESGNGLAIVDYKSGQRKPSPTEAATDVGMTITTFALRQTFGLRVESIEYRFLRDGSHIPAVRDESDFEHLLNKIMPQAERILEDGEFLPRPGFWCRWCDYRELCGAQGIELCSTGALHIFYEKHPSLCAELNLAHFLVVLSDK